MNVALLTNNKIKKASNKKIKNSKTFGYLAELNSGLYGSLYELMTPEYYKKSNKVDSIRLRYSFLDGNIVDEEDDENYVDSITYCNEYTYKKYIEFVSKMTEIFLSEHVLSRTHWIFDSNMAYVFMDFDFKMTLRNGDKIKSRDCSKIYDKLNSGYRNKNRYRPKFIIIDSENDVYRCFDKWGKIKQVMSKYSDSSDLFIEILPFTYIKVDKSIRKFDGCKVKTKVQLYEDDGIKTRYSTMNELNSKILRNDIFDLIILHLGVAVVNKLESTQYNNPPWRLKNKLISINGKKSHESFNEFIATYFPEI